MRCAVRVLPQLTWETSEPENGANETARQCGVELISAFDDSRDREAQ